MKKVLAFLTFFLYQFANAQTGRRLEILFLGDNSHHKPIDRVPSLMAALGPKGVNVTYTDKLEDLNSNYLNKFDALMIYANWDKIEPAQEKALLDFVASGKGLIPVHCASFCFRNSQEYIKLVGGQFWRHTMDSIRTNVVQPNHPVMNGWTNFTTYDETYLHSQLQPDNNILAVREIKSDQFKDKPDTKTEPYTWTRTHGKGKVFYTALGHDEQTWTQASFQDLLYRGILWAVSDDALSSFKARNPKPFEYREAKLPNYEQRPGVQLQQLPLSPEESMKHIQVPVDFKLELFAAEPNVMHPIAMAWDEKGRLFVLITKDYPNERKPEGGSDYILLCEDTDKDGKADKFTKWAEGLSIPTGMVFANDGLIVSQAPDMLFLQDTDGDNKADVKRKLFSGFGTFDTHAGPSNLHYGFDNWIWGCVGYSGYKGKFAGTDSLKFGQAFFKFKPDGSQMEWMTNTSNNTWGFGFNETNDVFGSTANNSHGWYMAIPHRYFNSKNNIDNGSRSTDTHRDMKPITEKVRQVDAFGGFTAAAGHNFYTARAFPEKYWNKMAFVAEPTGHILHQNNLQKRGTDFYDVESFNLMAGADEWFSPVFAQVGPDGAVWVADWYSYIIQHNPTPKGFGSGGGNAYDTDLRDFTHGRIYRVSYNQSPSYKAIQLDKNDRGLLLNTLHNDNLFWRMNAQRLLIERGKKDVVPQLSVMLKNTKIDAVGSNPGAIHALWTLKGLDALTPAMIETALKHPSAEVRKNAVLCMPNTAKSVALILKYKLLDDSEPLVVMNSLLVFSKSPMNATAEKAFFVKLNAMIETTDRWLPDAFACVLTANNGKLMKKYMTQLAAKQPIISTKETVTNHDHHAMQKETQANALLPGGTDLEIVKVEIGPKNPVARESILVTVYVKNNGDKNLEPSQIVPLDVKFEGMGIKVEQVSRNHKTGIKAGETVSISRNLNGPWEGDLRFYSDVAGDYNLSVWLDKENKIAELNEKNNFFTQKITYAQPPSMAEFALERALRSHSSNGNVSDIIGTIRNAQNQDVAQRSMVYKALASGWDYKRKGSVLVEGIDRTFLSNLNQSANNEQLTRILRNWGVVEEMKTGANVKVIKIKSVREAMQFDLKEFEVKAGQTVEIVFENPDAMQHNIVFVQPNAMEKVGTAADKMMMDQKGAEKNYVPELAEIFASSPLINPDQTYRFQFKAPEKAGSYPYVCTFPGHWRLMNGVMIVK